MNRSKTLLASAAALFITAGTASAATVVATADLHMRSGPGTEYPVIAVIPQGVAVHSRNCSAGWCRVDYLGRSGWASRAYLGGAASPPVYSYEYRRQLRLLRLWRTRVLVLRLQRTRVLRLLQPVRSGVRRSLWQPFRLALRPCAPTFRWNHTQGFAFNRGSHGFGGFDHHRFA